jgi:hypothetical protein
MNLVQGSAARWQQLISLGIFLVFFLNLVKSQNLNHNLSAKEKNELK